MYATMLEQAYGWKYRYRYVCIRQVNAFVVFVICEFFVVYGSRGLVHHHALVDLVCSMCLINQCMYVCQCIHVSVYVWLYGALTVVAWKRFSASRSFRWSRR